MCAHNGFFLKFLQFWFFYDCLTILRRVRFFTAYSVDIGDFLPHTQQTQEIFYRILSSRRRFFTAYSVGVGDFLPHTESTWNIFYRILSRRGIIWKICHPAVLCQRSRLYMIFTAYSVHVGDFLPHTQYTQEIFYRILSTRSIIFAAHSVGVVYFLAHTQTAEKSQNGE